jgi:hypothetical protein
LPWDLIEGKENCTLTMKIGKEHLVPAAREEITARRALWGTDIYTDDSDVIAACIHAGWFRGEWPDDVDVSLLGLNEGYSVSDVRGLFSVQGNSSKQAKLPSYHETSDLMILSEPPKNGPMPVPENRDLHVTLLILPRLEKYASTTRFGIKSREFGGRLGDEDSHQRAVHDGLSFMVIGMRWLTNGAAAQNRLRGKARRERIRKALAEVALTPAWISRPVDAAAAEDGWGRERESVLGWWKQSASRPPSEGDKENANREGGEKVVQEESRKEEETQGDGDKEQNQETGIVEREGQAKTGAEPEAVNEKGSAAAVGEKEAEEVPPRDAPAEKKAEDIPAKEGDTAQVAEAAQPEKAESTPHEKATGP